MYQFAYQLLFYNAEESLIAANLYDTLSGQGTTVFTQIEGAEDPLHLLVTDNDEDKFTPIRAKQAEIKFLSTTTVNLNTFIGSSDNRWYVEVMRNTDILFRGFLILDDMDEDFLDSDAANVVTLIATDNIGLLKDEPLTRPEAAQYTTLVITETAAGINTIRFAAAGININLFNAGSKLTLSSAGGANGTYTISGVELVFGVLIVTVLETVFNGSFTNAVISLASAGLNPRGYFTIISYIAWCLKKTGMNLPINIVHNLHEENNPGAIMYQSCYLQSKTFEAEIDESQDCYEVLNQILGNDCFLTQSGGEWWIVRVDELQNNATVVTKYSADGAFVLQSAFNPTTTFDPVGAVLFSGMATLVKALGAAKSAKLTYRYEYPREIVNNIDFSRGLLVQDFGNTKEYTLDDWTLKVNNTTTQLNPTTTERAYINRKFEAGYEKERYAVIQNPVSPNNKALYLSATTIPVHAGDRFDLHIDSRYNADINGGFYRHATMLVRLRDNNNPSTYTLHGGTSEAPKPYWQLGASFVYVVTEGNLNQDDQRNWKSIYKTTEYPPCPVDGELEISLVYNNNIGNEKSFSNFSFTYKPLINGSYAKFQGQYNKVSKAISTKKLVASEVSISDSPKKLFKGALYRYTGSRYVLAGLTYDGRLYPTAPPAAGLRKLFSRSQIDAVWNQSNRPFRLFDFQAQGLSGGVGLPDVIYKFTINETNVHTTGKTFMLLHFDQDLKTCEWKGVMAETFDTALQKDYTSPFEFKYISE